MVSVTKKTPEEKLVEMSLDQKIDLVIDSKYAIERTTYINLMGYQNLEVSPVLLSREGEMKADARQWHMNALKENANNPAELKRLNDSLDKQALEALRYQENPGLMEKEINTRTVGMLKNIEDMKAGIAAAAAAAPVPPPLPPKPAVPAQKQMAR